MKKHVVFAIGVCATITLAGCGQSGSPATDSRFHQWAATPPMGWNSWDCFGPTVTETEVKANADYMSEYLKSYGWEYIVVDIRWYVGNDKAHGYNQTDPQYSIDEYGRWLPAANRFPSAANGQGFKPLADYIHGKGLKFGIHIMRGVPVVAVNNNLPIKDSKAQASDIYTKENQCAWLKDMYTIIPGKEGSQAYYNSIFELYAAWGVDFVKVDDLSSPIYFTEEVEMIRKAIDRCGRPIVLSTSPGETPLAHAGHVRQYANMWRTVGDFWDNWSQLKEHFKVFERWNSYRQTGAWPDGDMLPLGHIGIRAERGNDRMSGFTRDEQRTLMTLWTIFRSPLMFGGHLPDNDSSTLSLLTNREVIYILNNSTANRPLMRNEKQAAWVADDPATGDKFLAVFNIADQEMAVESKARWVSPVISRDTPGQSIQADIDVKGAKKLFLVVTDAGDNAEWDHADWISPILYNDKDTLSLVSQRWRRATTGWWRVRVDSSVSGRELIVNGQKMVYGIGTHANSVIEYDLPAGYDHFSVLAGLDAAAATQPAGCTVRFMLFTEEPAGSPPPGEDIVPVSLSELGFKGNCTVTDCWSGKKIGLFAGDFSPVIPRHGCGLYRISPTN